MLSRRQLALNAFRKISDIWQIEADRVQMLDESNDEVIGFNWWPGSFCVKIRAYLKPENIEYPGIKLQMIADFIENITISERFEKDAANLSQYSISTYAWVYEPTLIGANDKDHKKIVDLFLTSSVYISEEINDWMTELFAYTSIIQFTDAHMQAIMMAELITSCRPKISKISPYSIKEYDKILRNVRDVFVPQGQKPSFFGCSNEFDNFTEKYPRQYNCFGTSDQNGMTLHVPFGQDRALIRFITSERHSSLGNGLLMTIQLPWFGDRLEIARKTAELNYYEAVNWTSFPQMGNWHPSKGRGEEAGVEFSLFMPNYVFQTGLITNLAFWALARVQLVKNIKFPYVKRKTMKEIIKERFDKMRQ
jgi:hypothetical protein